MELDLSREDETFRHEVRSFIAANFPAENALPVAHAVAKPDITSYLTRQIPELSLIGS